MLKKVSVLVLVLVATAAAVGYAQPSSFQYSCSNIEFKYGGGSEATLSAVCLRANGTPNLTRVLIRGISNQNGNLVQGSGPSSFQRSCGNIRINVNGPSVTLTALCRTMSGGSNSTSIPLNGISNQNGSLSY